MTTKNILTITAALLTVVAILLMVAGITLGTLGHVILGTLVVAVGITAALIPLAFLVIKVI
jgi:hypothetical protein